jgi:hypothetical protein
MGKKRKAGARPFGEPKELENAENSKMGITTFEDVADSEDEFHINRDKVLLEEGPAAKRVRKWKEQGMCSALWWCDIANKSCRRVLATFRRRNSRLRR